MRFAPGQRGIAESTLTALSDDDRGVSLNLMGRGLSPARLEVAADQVDFGNVVLEAAATLEVAVSNGGDQPLPAVSATLSGDVDEFSLVLNGCTEPVAPGGTCSISVGFAPSAPVARRAALQLDSAEAGSASVELLGAGVEPGLLLIAPADGSSTAFGNVLLGESLEQTFRITNPSDTHSGEIDITLNSPEFALVESGAAGACTADGLDPTASCEIGVRFTPAERQQRNTTLTVASALGSTSLNLNGLGQSPALLGAAGPLDFGSTPRGQSVTRTLDVTNQGDEPLSEVLVEVAGQHASDFVVARSDCNTNLGFEQSCTISIGFTPAVSGSRVATLRLESTPGGVREVRLEGRGLEPGALVLAAAAGSAASFDGGLVIGSGQTQTQTFVLSNAGEVASGPINVTALDGGFQLLSPTGSDCRSNVTDLGAGESCTLRVQFTPVARGESATTLTVSSASAGSTSLPLSGVGLAPPTLAVDSTQRTFDTRSPLARARRGR